MYIRHETRHFQSRQFRDNWGGSSSNDGGSSTTSSGSGEGSTGGGGGSGLGGIGSANSGAYGGVSQSSGGGWGGGNITDQNQSAAETSRLAALEAKTQAPAKSDWDRFVANSPSFSQAAKLAFGLFSSPLTGLYKAVNYNADRLANMSPDDIANERAIRAEIDANRVAGNGGSATYGGLQFGNAKSGTVSSVGGASGGSGAITGGLGGGGEMVDSSQGGKPAAGGGTGAGGLVASKDSPLGELAALATIAAVMLQILG